MKRFLFCIISYCFGIVGYSQLNEFAIQKCFDELLNAVATNNRLCDDQFGRMGLFVFNKSQERSRVCKKRKTHRKEGYPACAVACYKKENPDLIHFC